MDFLRAVKRRTLVSSAMHVILNLALVVAVYVLIHFSGSLWGAIALVMLSKWRIFSVRFRYWFANLQANTVDIIVGISTVVLLWHSSKLNTDVSFFYEIGFAVFYALWLTILKPRSKPGFVYLQAFIGLILGVWALCSVAHTITVLGVVFGTTLGTVAGMYIIGYSVARHVLTIEDEDDVTLLSMAHGILYAELGWVAYHWMVGYGFDSGGDVLFPQLGVIASAFTVSVGSIYLALKRKQSLLSIDYIAPLVCSIAVIVIVLMLFSDVGRNII